MKFNYLDLVIAIPLIIGLINGFRKGLVKSIASLLALILGVWGAIMFSKFVSFQLAERLSLSSQYLPIFSFIVTFIIFVIGVHILAGLLHKLIHAIFLGLFNKVGGSVFGVLRNAVLISVILFIVNYFNQISTLIPEETTKTSLLYEPISKIAPFIFTMDFKSWEDKIKEGVFI